MWKWYRLLGPLSFIGLGIVGCGEDDPTPVPQVLSTTDIGSEGGTLSSADGLMRLEVPAGALASSTALTVSSDAAADQLGGVISGTGFDFGPDGLRFQKPATLTIQLPEGAVGSDSALAKVVKVMNDEGEVLDGLRYLNPTLYDPVAHTLTATIAGFSRYIAVGLVGGAPRVQNLTQRWNPCRRTAEFRWTAQSGNRWLYFWRSETQSPPFEAPSDWADYVFRGWALVSSGEATLYGAPRPAVDELAFTHFYRVSDTFWVQNTPHLTGFRQMSSLPTWEVFPPDPMEGLIVRKDAPDVIRLDWSFTGGNPSVYRVERFPGWGDERPRDMDVFTFEYIDRNVDPSQNYIYRVTPIKECDGLSLYGGAQAVSSAGVVPQPSSPQNLSAQIGASLVTLIWDDDPFADEYEISRREVGASFSVLATLKAPNNRFEDSTAQLGVAYEYQVRSRNSAGSEVASITATPVVINPNPNPNPGSGCSGGDLSMSVSPRVWRTPIGSGTRDFQVSLSNASNADLLVEVQMSSTFSDLYGLGLGGLATDRNQGFSTSQTLEVTVPSSGSIDVYVLVRTDEYAYEDKALPFTFPIEIVASGGSSRCSDSVSVGIIP